ncbi:MAG: hypothetical protein ACU84Q_16855 [Gammaproteobacteria bacterium]
MKANAIYINKCDPRRVLEVADLGYFVVKTKHFSDIALADIISGDLTKRGVCWLLNLTRSTLVDIELLSRHALARDAIAAASTSDCQESVAVRPVASFKGKASCRS